MGRSEDEWRVGGGVGAKLCIFGQTICVSAY